MPGSTEKPFPKYLLKADARAAIEAIEDMDYLVDIRVPAVGSVSITITAPDGHSRTETGRVELLEEVLKTAARHCGIGIEDG